MAEQKVGRVPRLAAIVPAAGLSSRMGRFKPLLPLGSTTVVERVVSLCAEAALHQIIVVAGHAKEDLIPVVRPTGAQIVENPDYRDGMFSSIVAGVRHLDPECDAFFLLPVDIALVRPTTLARLARGYAAHPGCVIHPSFQGATGHPPLIPAALGPEILAWQGEGGLKGFFDTHAVPTVKVAVADRHVLFDSDTPDDFAEMTLRWDRYDVPTPAECEAILTVIHPVAERTLRHGRKVADIAERIGQALVASGLQMDLALIRAGALLHDVGKGQKDHAERGAAMIADLGFARVSRIVGAHTNLVPDPEGRIAETEVVFMADKVVRGDTVIPIAERFAEPLERWADDPSAVAIIEQRRQVAYLIKARLEARLGRTIEAVIGHDAG
jgi:putative nucleotidyltransferase with HDIG domain